MRFYSKKRAAPSGGFAHPLPELVEGNQTMPLPELVEGNFNRRTSSIKMGIQATLVALGLMGSVSVHAATDCNLATGIPKAECETLVALYNSTNGANWTDSATNNWNKTNTPCSWTGITCTNGRVAKIERGSRNLVGTLPNLSALTEIYSLSLMDNKLTGSVPDLSALTKLQYLYLYTNQLSGTLPSFSTLTELLTLNLSTNPLSGNIPDLSSLTKLQFLRMASSQFTGSFPKLAAKTTLKYLFVNNNQLTGPIPDLTGFTALVKNYVDISYNQLCLPSTAAMETWLNNMSPTWRNQPTTIAACTSNRNPQVTVGQTNLTTTQGTAVTLSGTFTDADTGDTHTIKWDFGDGTPTANMLTTTHTYTTPNTYTATLTVTDNKGGVGTASVPITVQVPKFTLNVTKTGNGTITSTPAGINCDADCTEDYALNTQVTLTATVASGSTFAGWSGGVCSGTTSCQVTMSQAKSVTANFNVIPQVQLSVTKTGNGTVSSTPTGINCGTDCNESYSSSTTVSLNATPSTDNVFKGWTGSCSGSNGTVSVTMDAAKSCTAVFEVSVTKPPAAVYERFAGTVVDQDGKPLAGTTVKVNGVEKQTGSDGSFEVYAPRTNRYVVNAVKSGYALVSQIENNLYGNANLRFTVKKADVIEILNPTIENTVADLRGTEIKLPANALVDANGNKPTGTVKVLMYTYDLANEAMPGDMGGTNGSGQSVYLESAGAFWAEFTDDSGKKYNLAPGQKATISVPAINNESAVDLWYYDETKGTWIEEGSASLVNGRFQGEVSHFSAWNFDWEKMTPACVKLEIDQTFYNAYKDATGNLTVKAVVTAPSNAISTQFLSFGSNAVSGSPHVLYNLPVSATVNLYAPTSFLPPPYATLSTGAAWTTTSYGAMPPHPYNDCKGQVTLSSPMVNGPDSDGFVSITGVGKGVAYFWNLQCPPSAYSGNPTTVAGSSATGLAGQLFADMLGKGAPVTSWGDSIGIGNCSLYVSNNSTNISSMCLVTAGGCSFNPLIRRVSKQQMLSTVKGFLWNDLNSNGLQDSNEAYLQGWTVLLKNPSGVETSKVTDANGYYEFANLSATGNYTAFVETRTGATYTTPQTVVRNVDLVNIPRTVSFAIKESPKFNLTVNKVGNGTVTSAPAGINCGTDCSELFSANTQVSLTAMPVTGFRFVSWTGSCAGTNATTMVMMDAEKSCTANFTSTTSTTVTLKPTIYPTKVCKGQPFDVTFGVETTMTIGSMSATLHFDPSLSNLNLKAISLVAGGTAGISAYDPTTDSAIGALFVAWRSPTSGMPPVINVPVGTTDIFKVINFIPTTVGTLTFSFNPDVSKTYSQNVADEDDIGIYYTNDLTQTNLGLQLTVEDCAIPSAMTLTVTKAGTGTGTVTSNPAGINCGGDCTEDYLANTVVALTATANAGSVFAGWSGACSGTGPCQVTMSQAKSVTATFNLIPKVTLTVSKAGTGTGTVTSSPTGINCSTDCTEDYLATTVVTLTAVAANGSVFAGWSGACSGTSTCQVTMLQAKSVTATFNLIPKVKLSVTKSLKSMTDPNTNAVVQVPTGTVTATGIKCGFDAYGNSYNAPLATEDCQEDYLQNTAIVLTATPAPGFTFQGWSGDCASGGSTNPLTVTMNSAKTCGANFYVKLSCSKTPTIQSVRSGYWNQPSTWNLNRVPDPWEADVILVNQAHTVTIPTPTGSNYDIFYGLCNHGTIRHDWKLVSNTGTRPPYYYVYGKIELAFMFIDNYGQILGSDWPNVSPTYYRDMSGDVTLMPTESFSNYPFAVVQGGNIANDLGGSVGGNVNIAGTINKEFNNYPYSIIRSGKVTSNLTNPPNNLPIKGSPGGQVYILGLGKGTNHKFGLITAGSAGHGKQQGGVGGLITWTMPNELVHRGRIQGSIGGGNSCSIVPCPSLPYISHGRISLTSNNKIISGQVIGYGYTSIDPQYLSLAGAQIEGEDVTIFGGDGAVLDLTGLAEGAITAKNTITIAAGNGGVVDLTGAAANALQAAGEVKILADDVILDASADLTDIIQAENVTEAPAKILYDMSIQATDSLAGKVGETLPIKVKLMNMGPAVDTYAISVTSKMGWQFSPAPPATMTVEAHQLGELNFDVILPNTEGEEIFTVTASSQGDPTISRSIDISLVAAKQIIEATIDEETGKLVTTDETGKVIDIEQLIKENEEKANNQAASGTVIDKKGNPLSGATIQINDKNTTTDANGAWQVDGLKEGNYTVTATKNGYTIAPKDFTVKGENATVNLEAIAVYQATGILKDKSGNPIANATIKVGNQTTTTDANGSWQINNLTDGQYQISITAPGFTESSQTCDIQEQSCTVNVKAQSLLTLKVKTQPTAVYQGQTLTYTFTVKNDGNTTATNVILTNVLPTEATLASWQAVTGGDCDTTNLTCTFPAIPAGAVATVQAIITNVPAGKLVNQAAISANEYPSDVVVTNTVVKPYLSVTPVCTPNPIAMLATLHCVLDVALSQDALETAKEVKVTTTLPQGVELQNLNTDLGACDTALAKITCSINELTGDKPATIQFDLKLQDGGLLLLTQETQVSASNYPTYTARTRTTIAIPPEAQVDLALVIDVTGSMQGEIDGVKKALQEFLQKLDTSQWPLLALVVFKDDVTVKAATKDMNSLLKAVESLKAEGGGTCPEASVEALEIAARHVRNGGQIWFTTDASPYPEADLENLINQLQSKNITLHATVTGDCAMASSANEEEWQSVVNSQ